MLHGGLAQFPLHASGRLTGSGWDCPLDRYAVSYAPSLAYLAAVRGRGTSGNAQELLLGVFDPTGDLGPSIAREKQAIRDMLEPSSFRPLDGAEATLEAFRTEAPNATVIHFAGHGTFDPRYPGNSGLHLVRRRPRHRQRRSEARLAGIPSGFPIRVRDVEVRRHEPAGRVRRTAGRPAWRRLRLRDRRGMGVPSDFAATFSVHFYEALVLGQTRPDLALRDAVRRSRDGKPIGPAALRRLGSQAEEEETGGAGDGDISSPLTWASFAIYGFPGSAKFFG